MYNINNLIDIVKTKRKVYFNRYTARNFKSFAWSYLPNFKRLHDTKLHLSLQTICKFNG